MTIDLRGVILLTTLLAVPHYAGANWLMTVRKPADRRRRESAFGDVGAWQQRGAQIPCHRALEKLRAG